MQKDTESFEGNELDDPGPVQDSPVSESVAPPTAVPKKSKAIRKGIGVCLLGLVVLIAAAFLLGKFLPAGKNRPEVVPKAIPQLQLTKFNSFVIPYRGGKNFSFISLSIAFYSPETALREEMESKKHLLRGTIYVLINRRTQQDGWNPSLPQLKELVRNAVNEHLSNGQIQELFITQYLVL